jgi:hypothetical protein
MATPPPSTQTLLELRVIQAIPTLGSINLSDLSAITSTQPSLLRKLLRQAVSSGFLSQNREEEYSHSAASLMHTSGGAALLDMLDEDDFFALGQFARGSGHEAEASRPLGRDMGRKEGGREGVRFEGWTRGMVVV